MNILRAIHSQAFPSSEKLWERNRAEMNGGIPLFDVVIDGAPHELEHRPLYRRDKKKHVKIGSNVLLSYTMSDGLDRLVSVNLLDDAYRSDADLLVTTSTAWTTTVGGYVGRRDGRIASETGLQTVSIGAEGSTNTRFLQKSSLKTVSLAKTAQSEQMILADASERFSLPTNHYGLGDSRGAMIKPGHSVYAPLFGNAVLFTDIKAPCVPEQLGIVDAPKIAAWLAVEAIGAAGVSTSLAKERDLGLLLGTFDTDVRSMYAAVAGVMPALMSGEAGRLLEIAPDDMHGHVVLYGHDILSPAQRWNELYATKPNMAIKNVPKGSHAHLLGKLSLQIARIGRAEEGMVTEGVIDDMYVIRGKAQETNKKQASLRLVVNR